MGLCFLEALVAMPFNTCPAGHTLPHHTALGRCNPLHCVDDVANTLKEIPAATDGDNPDDQIAKTAKDSVIDGAKRSVRKRSRERLVSVPEFKTPAEAEDWVNSEKARMAPYAIAEKEFQLLYGNDEQRTAASDYFLDATGHGKRDAGMGTQATIIIMGSIDNLKPWMKVPNASVLPAAGASVQQAITTVEALPTNVAPTAPRLVVDSSSEVLATEDDPSPPNA